MPVMDVRVMRVGMLQPQVSMPVSMRFTRGIGGRVLVLVVFVMVVEMFVLQRLMNMHVFMVLCDM
jgi:hypothetical protein